MALERLKIVGVMCPHVIRNIEQEVYAKQIGTLVAELGCHLLTGGGEGAMAVVSQEFTNVKNRRGRVIGIIPAEVSLKGLTYKRKKEYPNPFIEIPIFTHLHQSGRTGVLLRSRNHINVLTSDVVIMLEGGDGTLAEAYLALCYRKPVIAYMSNAAQMEGFAELGITRTDQLNVVMQFIQADVNQDPESEFELNETRLPHMFHRVDF